VFESLPQLAALMAGLLGSGHCVLMCGAVAGALNLGAPAHASCGRSLRYPVLYNFGRIASYTLAGGIAGALGGGALSLAGLPQLRFAFAALAALVVIVVGLRLATGTRHFGWLDRAGAAAWRRIAPATRGLFPITTPARALGVGLAWGWLPCGMAYAMLTAAWLSGGGWQGASLMAMFGIGTLPAMLALGAGAATLLRPSLRRIGGVLLVVLGLASGGAALWPGDASHEEHAGHHASTGAVAALPFDAGLARERAQPGRVQDSYRPALDLDHAELGET
jgi:sulfite exporter TauE/SafE